MRRAGAGEGPTGRDGRPPFGPPGLGTLCSAAPATPPPHLGARGGPGWGWRPQSPAVPPLALTYLCRGARRKGGGQGTAGLDAHSPGAGQQQFPELPLTRVPGLRWHMATRPRTRGWPCTHRQSPGFAVALGQEGPLPPCPRQPLGPCRSGHRHTPQVEGRWASTVQDGPGLHHRGHSWLCGRPGQPHTEAARGRPCAGGPTPAPPLPGETLHCGSLTPS